MFLQKHINIIQSPKHILGRMRSNVRQAIGELLLWSKFYDNQDLSLRFALSRILLWEQDSYFSQLWQDKRILEKVYPKVIDGFFIEIWANDWKYLSNTLALEQKWRTWICIEPWAAFNQLKLNRSCFTENYCILDYVWKVHFYDSLLRKWLFNGIVLNHEIEWTAIDRVVNTTTVTSLLSKYTIKWNKIHYLSVDTEWSELQVLLGIDFEIYHIGAITIEHNFDKRKRYDIKMFLEQKWFILNCKVKREDWYINPAFCP